MKSLVRGLLLLCAIAMLTACAARATGSTSDMGPGFILGLWHGLIAPVAFLVHLFVSNVAVYAVPNSGGWYDFGFLLGIGAFSTGAAASTK